MPFIANTPESLVARSDSKNPATTCRGVTSSGRPCRRPLATPGSPQPPPPPPPRTKFSRLRVDDPRDETLYCWQHKEQASVSARSSPGPRRSATPILEERTSIDTLADRLGLETRRSTFKSGGGRPSRPPHHYHRQHHSGAAGVAAADDHDRPSKMTRPKPKMHLFCCCFKLPIEEVNPPPRPKPLVLQPLNATAAAPQSGRRSSGQQQPSLSPRPGHSSQSQHNNSGRASRHSSVNSATSQTAQYMSLIPASASPQTASALMAELAKPVSQLDEPGYIYIFWLTPETQQSAPPADAARSLLTPPSRPGAGQRRPSDVIASFAAADTASSRSPGSKRQPAKILLKIGRANNVQRRLNEWKRQCGYNLSLIRYYPYIPSSSPGPVAVPRKMPHSHKVERLIHIELAGAGLRLASGDKCDACGREHREWFEVEGSRKGIMQVDEIVRRWADWDEGRI